jgi:hypothetical protein
VISRVQTRTFSSQILFSRSPCSPPLFFSSHLLITEENPKKKHTWNSRPVSSRYLAATNIAPPGFSQSCALTSMGEFTRELKLLAGLLTILFRYAIWKYTRAIVRTYNPYVCIYILKDNQRIRRPLYFWVKLPEREGDYSRPFSDEVKKAWTCRLPRIF